jgi:hypothetical protein
LAACCSRLFHCLRLFLQCTDDKTFPSKMLPLDGCVFTEAVKNKSSKCKQFLFYILISLIPAPPLLLSLSFSVSF